MIPKQRFAAWLAGVMIAAVCGAATALTPSPLHVAETVDTSLGSGGTLANDVPSSAGESGAALWVSLFALTIGVCVARRNVAGEPVRGSLPHAAVAVAAKPPRPPAEQIS